MAVLAPQNENAANESNPRKRRVQFIDLLRLLASFQMVHGHTLDAVMNDELRQGELFTRWTFMRGTVSIGFMFAAGISFHLSTLPKFEAHKKNPDAVGRRFRRFFDLMFIGYILHFPGAAWSGDAAAAEVAWNAFFMVDVLQCIATGIVILQVMTMAFPRKEYVVAGAFALSVLSFGLAPYAESLSPEGPFRFAINYLTHAGGSQFPLLPWSGYLFAGLVVGAWLIPDGVKSPVKPIFPRALMLTIGLATLSWILYIVPWTAGESGIHPASHPSFAIHKFAVTSTIVTVLAFIGQRITRLPRFLETLASESLIVYVSHLVILYGGGIGVHRWLGRSLDFGEALVVATLMLPVTCVIALSWPRFRRFRESKKRARKQARLARRERILERQHGSAE